MATDRTEGLKALLAGLLMMMLMLPVLFRSGEGAGRFAGRWRLVGESGGTSSWLTIGRDGAKRDHAGGRCVPEEVGGELRLAWPDGFRDVVRQGPSGPEFLALPQGDRDWTSEPRFKLRMERR